VEREISAVQWAHVSLEGLYFCVFVHSEECMCLAPWLMWYCCATAATHYRLQFFDSVSWVWEKAAGWRHYKTFCWTGERIGL